MKSPVYSLFPYMRLYRICGRRTMERHPKISIRVYKCCIVRIECAEFYSDLLSFLNILSIIVSALSL